MTLHLGLSINELTRFPGASLDYPLALAVIKQQRHQQRGNVELSRQNWFRTVPNVSDFTLTSDRIVRCRNIFRLTPWVADSMSGGIGAIVVAFSKTTCSLFNALYPSLYVWGSKKSNEKKHDSWINSYFSASERSIPMRFSTICSSTFLHWKT